MGDGRKYRAGSGSKWVMLANTRIADRAIERIMNAHPNEPRLAVFYGAAGLGKSAAVQVAQRAHNAVAVQVRSIDTRKTFLAAICRELGLPTRGTLPEIVDDVSAALAMTQRPLILDEADYLVRNSAIELVRDLHEIAGTPILLVGEEQLPKKLLKWERFHSRVLSWEQARQTNLDDARRLAAFYCPDLEITEEWLKEVIAVTMGNCRRITVNLNAARALAATHGHKRIGLEEWQAARASFFTGEAGGPVRG